MYEDRSEVTEQRWIPFVLRKMTDEEKEVMVEIDFILDCKLPEYEERILILHKDGCVYEDTFFCDDGCYLDSGSIFVTEAVAWMPLPEPYRGMEVQE